MPLNISEQGAAVIHTAETDTALGRLGTHKAEKTGSYLTIEPKDGSSVPVAVWETTAEDELALDRYEGYPTFYYKKELVLPIKGIKTGKVRNRKVYVYIMHEDRPIGIPSKSYVRTCIEGYNNFGFDIDVLKSAYEPSRKECLNGIR